VSYTSMFDSKTTKMLRTRRNIGSIFAMLFCTFVLVSTIGISSGIRSSFAQQDLQTQQQQPSTLSQSPWSNDLPTAGNNWQVLCGHGVCNPSSGADNPQQMSPAASGDPQQLQNQNDRQHNTTLDLAFTNTKNLDLSHIFTSTKTIGPDRFRFVESYWTTETTANSINVGTSTGVQAGTIPVTDGTWKLYM
jgi:hypothetical protein